MVKKFKEHIKQEAAETKEFVRLLRKMEFNLIALDITALTLVRLDSLETFSLLKRRLTYYAKLLRLHETMLEDLYYYYSRDSYDYRASYESLKQAVDKALAGDAITYEEVKTGTLEDVLDLVYEKGHDFNMVRK